MARRKSILPTLTKLLKEIDKANKQAAKYEERRAKNARTAEAMRKRAREKALRELERNRAKTERERKLAEKQSFKDALFEASELYKERCEDRSTLRMQFIKEVLK